MAETYAVAVACMILGFIGGHRLGRREAGQEVRDAKLVAQLVIDELTGEVKKLRSGEAAAVLARTEGCGRDIAALVREGVSWRERAECAEAERDRWKALASDSERDYWVGEFRRVVRERDRLRNALAEIAGTTVPQGRHLAREVLHPGDP